MTNIWFTTYCNFKVSRVFSGLVGTLLDVFVLEVCVVDVFQMILEDFVEDVR